MNYARLQKWSRTWRCDTYNKKKRKRNRKTGDGHIKTAWSREMEWEPVAEDECNCRLAPGKHISHNEAFAALNNLLLRFANSSGSRHSAAACVCEWNRIICAKQMNGLQHKRKEKLKQWERVIHDRGNRHVTFSLWLQAQKLNLGWNKR